MKRHQKRRQKRLMAKARSLYSMQEIASAELVIVNGTVVKCKFPMEGTTIIYFSDGSVTISGSL